MSKNININNVFNTKYLFVPTFIYWRLAVQLHADSVNATKPEIQMRLK